MMRMIASGMSLTGKDELEDTSSNFVNSFHHLANELLAFWLFLVASSHFVFNKNANFLTTTIPNAREDVNYYLDRESYLNSLLSLEEEEDSDEWLLSDSKPCSKQELESDPDHGFASQSYNGNWGIEISLETPDTEELNLDAEDEPLFWPFEGKLNWNSEETWSSFSTSPRRNLCGVNYEASRLSAWSKKSEKIIGATECVDKTLVVDSKEEIHLEMEEYFDLGQDVTIEKLVGLEEFDGHQGIDSEFCCDVFLMDEFKHNE